jgi:putative RNA 2'-phosphotransferase
MLSERELVRVSKRLSRVLRHAPGDIGIELSPGGWVDIETLLGAMARHGRGMSRTDLDEVVARNDKQRFTIDDGGIRIRANQGHSVDVDLGLSSVEPPDVLYHGTVERFLEAIERNGLRPMKRHAVHLSATVETAVTVGARRGRAVVLQVDAAGMRRAGHEFQISDNGVWLTDAVPPAFLHRIR